MKKFKMKMDIIVFQCFKKMTAEELCFMHCMKDDETLANKKYKKIKCSKIAFPCNMFLSCDSFQDK